MNLPKYRKTPGGSTFWDISMLDVRSAERLCGKAA
jgi:hypothetical protein